MLYIAAFLTLSDIRKVKIMIAEAYLRSKEIACNIRRAG
jgi:hypothetical protein